MGSRWGRRLVALIAVVVSVALMRPEAAVAKELAYGNGIRYQTYSLLEGKSKLGEFSLGVRWAVLCTGETRLQATPNVYGIQTSSALLLTMLEELGIPLAEPAGSHEVAALNAAGKPAFKDQLTSSVRLTGQFDLDVHFIDVALNLISAGKFASKVGKFVKPMAKSLAKLAKASAVVKKTEKALPGLRAAKAAKSAALAKATDQRKKAKQALTVASDAVEAAEKSLKAAKKRKASGAIISIEKQKLTAAKKKEARAKATLAKHKKTEKKAEAKKKAAEKKVDEAEKTLAKNKKIVAKERAAVAKRLEGIKTWFTTNFRKLIDKIPGFGSSTAKSAADSIMDRLFGKDRREELLKALEKLKPVSEKVLRKVIVEDLQQTLGAHTKVGVWKADHTLKFNPDGTATLKTNKAAYDLPGTSTKWELTKNTPVEFSCDEPEDGGPSWGRGSR